MARRFDLGKVSHSAAVFDVGKLAWMNRHYMKEAAPARIAREAFVYFTRAGFVTHTTDAALGYLASLLPMAVGSVDRLNEIPERVAFVFAWNEAAACDLVRAESEGPTIIRAMADEVHGPLDRDSFRAAAARVRDRTGLKGRALFHPLRVALTAADSGPELDLAVPAIDRGAALPPGSGVVALPSCAERLRAVATLLQ
jgi:glutamyl-tRNA synthetase/nondiscriminating glutamyl-tRNA synthetase